MDLYFDWLEFRVIFERDDDDRYLEKLWPFAGRFLARVFLLFVDRLTLGICRFCDAAQSGPAGKFHNLTLDRIVDRVRERGDAELADILADLMNEVRATSTPLRDYRDKGLAHLDLEVSLGDLHRELPTDAFIDSMRLLRSFFDALNEEYRGTKINYDEPAHYADGAMGALMLMADSAFLHGLDRELFEHFHQRRIQAWGEIHPKARRD